MVIIIIVNMSILVFSLSSLFPFKLRRPFPPVSSCIGGYSGIPVFMGIPCLSHELCMSSDLWLPPAPCPST